MGTNQPKKNFDAFESTKALFRMNTGEVEIPEEKRRVIEAHALRLIKQHPPKRKR
jgi:hypothetical protein